MNNDILDDGTVQYVAANAKNTGVVSRPSQDIVVSKVTYGFASPNVRPTVFGNKVVNVADKIMEYG